MINILPGATNQSIDIFIQDSSATDGSGLTGLVYNTASLTCYYRRGATGTATALTLATQTVGGAHSDGGFVAIDGTNCPGLYRLDLSDAIVASGVDYVTLYLHGATNMAPTVVRIYLEDKVAVTDILSDGVALNCTSGTLDAVTTAGSVTGAVGSVTGNVGGNVTGSIGSLATQAKADVNAEVLDCLRTDVLSELGAVPAANAAIADKINWLFINARNKITQSATTQTVFADDGTTPVATSAVSTAAGTTTRAEFA